MKKYYLGVLLASVSLALFTMIQPMELQKLIDSINVEEKISHHIIFLGLSIVGILFSEMCRKILTGKFIAENKHNLRSKIMNGVLNKKYNELDEKHAQNIVTMLNQDVDNFVECYFVQILDMVYCVLLLVLNIIVLCHYSWVLTIISLLGSCLPIIIAFGLGKKEQKKKDIFLYESKRLNVKIADMLNGLIDIKTNQAEKEFLENIEKNNYELQDSEKELSKVTAIIEMMIGCLSYMGTFLLITIGTIMIKNNSLTFGKFVAILQINEMLAIPTNSIAFQINEIKSVKGIKNKILSYCKEQQKDEEKKIVEKIHTIELKDISMTYDNKVLFKNINYTFEAGKKYLIMGDNGSGKSTLLKIITNINSDYKGNVFINHVQNIELGEQLFSEIGIIMQKPYIFNASFLDNICVYKKYDYNRIDLILRHLNLKQSDNVDFDFLDMYDNLSGGEKQKVALARILLSNKNVILLDEATSAIDSESTYYIENNLLENKELMLIHVAHKISTELLCKYDKILTLADGTLIEQNINSCLV